jgi:hypothetical protein
LGGNVKRPLPVRDSAQVVVTKYTIPAETVREIRKAAPIYGSQGRALQVATEMLIRMEPTPLPEPPRGRSPSLVRVSMCINGRLSYPQALRDQIQRRSAQAIKACMKVLRMKGIKI